MFLTEPAFLPCTEAQMPRGQDAQERSTCGADLGDLIEQNRSTSWANSRILRLKIAQRLPEEGRETG